MIGDDDLSLAQVSSAMKGIEPEHLFGRWITFKGDEEERFVAKIGIESSDVIAMGFFSREQMEEISLIKDEEDRYEKFEVMQLARILHNDPNGGLAETEDGLLKFEVVKDPKSDFPVISKDQLEKLGAYPLGIIVPPDTIIDSMGDTFISAWHVNDISKEKFGINVGFTRVIGDQASVTDGFTGRDLEDLPKGPYRPAPGRRKLSLVHVKPKGGP